MVITRDNKSRAAIKFEKEYDHIDIILPNKSRLQIQFDQYRKGVSLRGVPNIGLGTIRIYPQAGNFISLTVDEEVKDAIQRKKTRSQTQSDA